MTRIPLQLPKESTELPQRSANPGKCRIKKDANAAAFCLAFCLQRRAPAAATHLKGHGFGRVMRSSSKGWL
jgi:hypothetical protein